MPGFPVARAGAILAVSDFAASLRFYRDQLGLDEVALYDDPPWGGSRFFCVDPDGYLIEIEQPALLGASREPKGRRRRLD